MTLSGGIDSTVLAHWLVKRAKKLPLCVYIDYETKSREGEFRASRKTCEDLGLRFVVLPFHIYKDIAQSFILGNTDEYEEGAQFWLEGRNAIISLILSVMAATHGVKDVYIGINYDDYDGKYLDTTSSFVDAVNGLLKHSIRTPVTVQAPWLDLELPKSGVIRLGEEFGVDWLNTTHSCSSAPTPCLDYENCESCYWLKEDFGPARLADPFNRLRKD
jgi:queuosine biosynthesis protein QueC